MSIHAHLIHRCVVQSVVIEENPLGSARKTWPATHWQHDVACRLVVGSERKIQDETAQQVVVTTYRLILAAGAGVSADDRIGTVTLEDGSEVAGPFAIIAQLPRRSRRLHHQTLELRRVS